MKKFLKTPNNQTATKENPKLLLSIYIKKTQPPKNTF